MIMVRVKTIIRKILMEVMRLLPFTRPYFAKIPRLFPLVSSLQPEKNRNRKENLLSLIDPFCMEGLEIGPLSRPIVNKSDRTQIYYVDYASSEKLKEVYQNDSFVKIDEIVETDFIWGEKTLPELINGKRFNYIIASHVIEHVPDLIGWLMELAEVLEDNGILSLAIPDKRYTFDYLRELSSPGMILDAYIRHLRRPSPQAIFDYMALSCALDPADAWAGKIDRKNLKPASTLEEAFYAAHQSAIDTLYHDAHVNIFTPTRFLELLDIFSQLNLVDFFVADFYDTSPNSIEFFVSLKRFPRSLNKEDKIRLQRESIQTVLSRLG
jgi:hypothetical protein